jgi:glycosyltransferase involved in cell wall biosynthesis
LAAQAASLAYLELRETWAAITSTDCQVINSVLIMDILVVSPTPSHPANAGNRQALYHIGKYLRDVGYTTHFLYYADEGISAKTYDEMRQHWSHFYLLPRSMVPVIGKIGVDDIYDDCIGQLSHLIIQMFDIRLVMVNYIFYSKLLEKLPQHITKIIHTHDRFGDRHHLFTDTVIRQEVVSTSVSEEARALKRADKIIAVQDGESSYFAEISGRPAYVLQQIFPTRFLARHAVRAERFGYIGSLNTINAASIRELIAAFQSHRADFPPDARLRIAGGICEAVEELADDRVEVIGPVASVEEFYRQVDVIVNPMKVGTGLKIKTVEALSFGLPVLSTTEGVSGIAQDSPYMRARSINELVGAMSYFAVHSDAVIAHQKYCREIFLRYSQRVTDTLTSMFPPIGSGDGVANLGNADELTLWSYDFKGEGWYAYESAHDEPFRWSGPQPTSEIKLPFSLTPHRVGVVNVINAIQPQQLSGARILYGDTVLETEVTKRSDHAGEIRFRTPPGLPLPRGASLKIVLPFTISPNSVNPSIPDTRRLGLAVQKLTIST